MRALCAGLALLIVGGMAGAEAQPYFGGGGYGGYYRPYGPRAYGYGPRYGYGYRRCFIRPTPFGPRRICRY